MTNKRAQEVGQYLLALRGTMDRTKAAEVSGLSRQWWLDTEAGRRLPRDNKLAQAVRSLGGDVVEALEPAGYDPAPYLRSRPVSELVEAAERESQAIDENLAVVLDRLDDLDRRVDRLEQQSGGGGAATS